jgi:hypothetical protein
MSYWRRGREYSDYEEYLDEKIEYKLDAMKEEIERSREEKEKYLEEGGEEEGKNE